jgi:5'-nucleotidase
MNRRTLALGIVALALVFEGRAHGQALRVLVTNDDGIAAAGIAAVVDALIQNPNLTVYVIAPATNQSGTTDTFTDGPITATASMTASGFPGTAVDGTPADSVLYALLVELAETPPDLVVSGVNQGQNITRFVAEDLSGTVGAALTAARRGVPAIAASQGLTGGIDYTTAATYVANVAELFRTNKGLQKKMISQTGLDQRLVLNVNVPSCASGTTVRGVRVVPLKESQDLLGRTVAGYDIAVPGVFTPVFSGDNTLGAQNCASTLADPAHDLDAFRNGFISVTPLNPTLTPDSKISKFKRLERVAFE